MSGISVSLWTCCYKPGLSKCVHVVLVASISFCHRVILNRLIFHANPSIHSVFPYFTDGQENTTIEYFNRHGLRESNVTHIRVRGTNALHVTSLCY